MSVLARVFEEHGIATVTIAMVREHAEKVKPPRALFVPFFFGFALGRPNDSACQHQVLNAAFHMLKSLEGPVLVDFPDDSAPTAMPQASQVASDTALPTRSAADEITAMRAFYERWLENNGGRTAVGLCGIPQRRFRGVIRFLESCAEGEEQADMSERPASITRHQFIRYCADDLKAFFYEARMEQNKEADEEALHRWFWGSTACGKLIADVAARLNDSDDASLKAIAYGLAR